MIAWFAIHVYVLKSRSGNWTRSKYELAAQADVDNKYVIFDSRHLFERCRPAGRSDCDNDLQMQKNAGKEVEWKKLLILT